MSLNEGGGRRNPGAGKVGMMADAVAIARLPGTEAVNWPSGTPTSSAMSPRAT